MNPIPLLRTPVGMCLQAQETGEDKLNGESELTILRIHVTWFIVQH